MSWEQWRDGNRVSLLENGEAFYPRVFEAIRAAEREVLLETFILFQDKVGDELQQALIAAAQRGARVEVTVDGYGCYELTDEFIRAMTDAGVRFHLFDPRPTLLGVRTNLFRRLHRKIVVIDGRIAFVGGINYSADHLRDFGPTAKQDYAVELEGPIVEDIHRFTNAQLAPVQARERRRWWRWSRARPIPSKAPKAGDARLIFVTRDNQNHRTDIERHYRATIRLARKEVIVANAYFFPGYRLLREIRNAARRGVRVSLILQGQPDKPIMKWAANTLYDYLLRAGVQIHEYCERPLHGKVALVDDEWSTVGSSNLDPLSLWLNLEANVMILDRAFNASLRRSLQVLIDHQCRQIPPERARKRPWGRQVVSFFVFHLLRRVPAWAGWLPPQIPQQTVLPPSSAVDEVAEKRLIG